MSMLATINSHFMNCFLLLTNHSLGKEFVGNYVQENNLGLSNIIFYDEKIVVDTVRFLKRSLLFKLKPQEKKIIVLNNEITIEAQNALLKFLEELSEQVTLFIITQSHEHILPTISSRCKILKVPGHKADFKSNNIISAQKNLWKMIDEINDLGLQPEDSILLVIENLREILLSDTSSTLDKKFAYGSIKELQKLSPLVINNNVQLRVVLEKVFFY